MIPAFLYAVLAGFVLTGFARHPTKRRAAVSLLVLIAGAFICCAALIHY